MLRIPGLRWLALLILITSSCDRSAAPARPESGSGPPAEARGASTVDPYPLSGDGVGPVFARGTRAELRRVATVVRDTVELGDEAIPESVAVLVVGGDTVRAVLSDSGRVYRLQVASQRFRTTDSLGVGSTLGRLLQEPGVYALGGEGAVYVQVPRRCGLSFRLVDAGELGYAPDSLGAAQLRRLPLSTRVSDVLVVGCKPRTP